MVGVAFIMQTVQCMKESGNEMSNMVEEHLPLKMDQYSKVISRFCSVIVLSVGVVNRLTYLMPLVSFYIP